MKKPPVAAGGREPFGSLGCFRAVSAGGFLMRFPKPWYRAQRGLWYVTLDGHQINLGSDKEILVGKIEVFNGY